MRGEKEDQNENSFLSFIFSFSELPFYLFLQQNYNYMKNRVRRSHIVAFTVEAIKAKLGIKLQVHYGFLNAYKGNENIEDMRACVGPDQPKGPLGQGPGPRA